MLHAAQARKIASESDAELKSILVKVGEKIELAAKGGDYTLNLSEAFRSWDRFQCSEPNISTGKPVLTDFQKKLSGELSARGYSFTLKTISYTEGGGLGYIDPEDYVEPQVKTRFDIMISW